MEQLPKQNSTLSAELAIGLLELSKEKAKLSKDKESIAAVLATLADDERPALDELDDDILIRDVPAFRTAIDLGRLHVLFRAAKLPVETKTKIQALTTTPEGLSDDVLKTLIDVDPKVKKLGALRVAYLLADDDEKVLGAIDATSVEQLIAMRPSDWKAGLDTNSINPPKGYESRAAWAAELARRHAALAPDKAFRSRLMASVVDESRSLDIEKAAAAWPGFNLTELANQAGSDDAKKQAAVRAALGPVQNLFAANPKINWLALDYAPGSKAIESLDLSRFKGFERESDRKNLLTALKAQQRAFGLAGDVDTGIALLEAGFHDTQTIAHSDLTQFLRKTRLSSVEATRLYQKARAMQGMLGNMALGVHGIVDGPFGRMPVSNLQPPARDYLAKLPGYAEMFGHQGWCDCKACGSILGPAAYFVDLMSFVDDHVRTPLFASNHPNHVLDLQTRRSDLWTLPLTCENTDTEVASLDLVNEVLENYLARDGNLDRAGVQRMVYQDTLYNAGVVKAFDQPFCLPRERVNLLLVQAQVSRAEVSALVRTDKAPQVFDLNERSYAQVFPEDRPAPVLGQNVEANHKALVDLFGVFDGGVAAVDVPVFLRTTGLTRSELGVLFSTWFVKRNVDIRIEPEKSSAGNSFQNDIERIHGLTADLLDRLHRFVRLARSASLDFADLDGCLQALNLRALTAADGEQLARLLVLRQALGASVEEAIALCALPPDRPLPAGEVSWFDERFNRWAPLAGEERLPKDAIRFVLPMHRPANGAGGDAGVAWMPRLCAGIGVDEEDLVRLVSGLSGALDMQDLAAGFVLSKKNLCLLHRHALLAHQLKLSVSELLQLLSLVPDLRAPWVSGLDDLEKVWSFVRSWREGRRTLDELALICGQDLRDPAAWPAANELDEQWKLALPAHALTDFLAEVFKVDSSKAKGLQSLVGLGHDRHPPLTQAQWVKLVRVAALCAPAEIDSEALGFIKDAPQVFHLQDLNVEPVGLGAATVWAVDRYARFTRAPDVARGDAQTVLERARFHALIVGFDAGHGGGFDAAADADLAVILRADASLVASCRTAGPVTAADPLDTLTRLAQGVDMARRLGVGGDTLSRIAAGSYQASSQAAAALAAGLAVRTNSAETAQAQLQAVDDALRGRRRDALCTYLLRNVGAHDDVRPWQSRSDLSAYFLLDVEVEGCVRTSRVAAAIAALQAYVHRIQMNLEHDAHTPPKLVVEPALIPAGEWAWRQHYRTWQANRKVFLWPENYLEPDLRDDKTEQFVELESNLLQQDINEQNAQGAYARYLAGFEDIAKLRIGGCWYETDRTPDRLHLFGATSADPPVWYYRTIDNLRNSVVDASAGVRWGPWVKVNAKIPVREVSPVVHQGRLHVFWVELRTRAISDFEGGSSKFKGYDHTMSVRFVTLCADGSWTAPQDISLDGWPFKGISAGVIQEKNDPDKGHTNLGNEKHEAPKDDHSLRGLAWNRIHIDTISSGRLAITGRNHRFSAILDLYGRKPVVETITNHPRVSATRRLNNILSIGFVIKSQRSLRIGNVGNVYGHFNATAGTFLAKGILKDNWRESSDNHISEGFGDIWDSIFSLQIATVPADTQMHSVACSDGGREDAIIQIGFDPLLVLGSAYQGREARIVRLGTTLAESFSRTLFEGGIDAILAVNERTDPLKESNIGISDRDTSILKFDAPQGGVTGAKSVLTGPLGTWYSEIFFHIPWRIAVHLNAQGKFAEAQRWFEYIFDPKATGGKSPDRVWRFVGLKELGVESLRDALTMPSAIEAYKADPFNPHAIARCRPTAYQKNLVMRYVDNLLDWADSLFTEFSTESIRQATQLYQLAQAILGDRPQELAACGQKDGRELTYEKLKPALDKNSEFLVELESWYFSKNLSKSATTTDESVSLGADRIATAKDVLRRPGEFGKPFQGWDLGRSITGAWSLPEQPVATKNAMGNNRWRTVIPPWKDGLGSFDAGFSAGLIRQMVPAFCIPANSSVLDYWDRVDDRLHKIRHGQDINGTRRSPSLFGNELDPANLVRGAALGLALDDVVAAKGEALPPYRFTFLIEKAKAMASSLASFGAVLQSALERRDGETLTRLQLVQQQNMAALTTAQRRLELSIAEESLAAVERQIEAAMYRRDYYADLKERGRTGTEVAQSILTHRATGFSVLASVLGGLATLAYPVPQVGAPTSMKYGGKELGDSLTSGASVLREIANYHQAMASSVGFEVGFERRDEDWIFQRKLADHELRQLDKQYQTAVLHRNVAAKALDLHAQSITDLQETFDFYNDKFTDLGLFTWMANQLQRVHREAYGTAIGMAQLAARAFRYERSAEATVLEPSYWDAKRAGLGAGDRLLCALQALEKRFIESDHRLLEISQSFSLRSIDPAQLLVLRNTGSCTITLPEWLFDLSYPGQYRRRIKSVRLTLPCVTGPYTNVSAVLELTHSSIRGEARDALVEFPAGRVQRIATSSASMDAGVFELTFRDERYLPFEGAGAVSRWKLELPSVFRSFDYRSISDAILTVSYNAEHDDNLKQQVQAQNGALQQTLVNTLRTQAVPITISVRTDFPAEFDRLMRSPVGTAVNIKLTEQYLPFWLSGRSLKLSSAKVVLDVGEGQSVTDVRLSFDGGAPLVFGSTADFGRLPAAEVQVQNGTEFIAMHSLIATEFGRLSDANAAMFDRSKLNDIWLVFSLLLR